MNEKSNDTTGEVSEESDTTVTKDIILNKNSENNIKEAETNVKESKQENKVM